MTTQVGNIYKYEDSNAQNSELNRFLACEEIVEELVEQGLPSSFVPGVFISNVAKMYGISFQEAKTCVRLAMKQSDVNKQTEVENMPQEEMNGNSNYFYLSGYTQNPTGRKDGMDSLSSLGAYNKLMSGIV